MAAIEKICEFSGDYEGWIMWKHKRNHIQVLSKYRDNFRGAEHTLHVFKPELQWSRGKGTWDYNNEMDFYEPPFNNEKEFINYYSAHHKARLVKEYQFALEIKDDSLIGEVSGIYMNWTNDLQSTKRRLKRMLRKDLNIVYHDCTYWDWKDDE